jgi:hypothetical protein
MRREAPPRRVEWTQPCQPLFQPPAGCWVYASQREFCERPRFEVTAALTELP